MKKDIHPVFFSNATAVCACGASFVVGSTMENMEVEICSVCHPFYTGADKVLDTAGRVEKFKSRIAAAKPARKKKDTRSAKRLARANRGPAVTLAPKGKEIKKVRAKR